jgi:predicted HTH transcriptional regulator
MPLTAEQLEMVANDLKRVAVELNLSPDQKDKLRTCLGEAYEKVQEYVKANPNVSREDLAHKVAENRTSIRQRLVNFLSPDQLSTWDAEIAKSKEFLGQKLAA